MAKLTTAARNALPDSAFADPTHRKYPVMDAGHRQAAAGRIAQHATGSYAAKLRHNLKEHEHSPMSGRGPVDR